MLPILEPTYELLAWFTNEYPYYGYAASYIRVNWLINTYGIS